MSVDQQEQPDQICPKCRKAIRKRSKGSFTAWIFQDSFCRCGKTIADEVVAASAGAAVDPNQARKRSLLGEAISMPAASVNPQRSAPVPVANTQAPQPSPSYAPPIAQSPPPLSQSYAQDTSEYTVSPPQVVAPEKPAFVTIRDLVIATMTGLVVFLTFKLTGNEQTALGIVVLLVVATLIAIGVRFVRR